MDDEQQQEIASATAAAKARLRTAAGPVVFPNRRLKPIERQLQLVSRQCVRPSKRLMAARHFLIM
jgi:hypothetical protein